MFFWQKIPNVLSPDGWVNLARKAQDHLSCGSLSSPVYQTTLELNISPSSKQVFLHTLFYKENADSSIEGGVFCFFFQWLGKARKMKIQLFKVIQYAKSQYPIKDSSQTDLMYLHLGINMKLKKGKKKKRGGNRGKTRETLPQKNKHFRSNQIP